MSMWGSPSPSTESGLWGKGDVEELSDTCKDKNVNGDTDMKAFYTEGG